MSKKSSMSDVRLVGSNVCLLGVLFLPAILFAIGMSRTGFEVKLGECRRAAKQGDQAKIPPLAYQLYFGADAKPGAVVGFPYFGSDWTAIPNRGLCPIKAKKASSKKSRRRLLPDAASPGQRTRSLRRSKPPSPSMSPTPGQTLGTISDVDQYEVARLGSFEGIKYGIITGVKFNAPYGVAPIASSPYGIYVASWGNYKVLSVDATSGLTVSRNWLTRPGEGGGGQPNGVAVRGSNLWVTDSSGSPGIRKLATTDFSSCSTVATTCVSPTDVGSGFDIPFGVAATSSHVFIADKDNNKLKKMPDAGGTIEEIAPTLLSPATFDHPSGIALDSSDNLYVADTNNNRIVKVTAASSYAGSSAEVLGASAYPTFCFPEGVAVDTSGNVYVADTCNDLIRKIPFVSGVYGPVENMGEDAYPPFNRPKGLTVATEGSVQFLYVADTGNNLMRKIKLSTGEFEPFPGRVKFTSTATGALFSQDDGTSAFAQWSETGSALTLSKQSGGGGLTAITPIDSERMACLYPESYDAATAGGAKRCFLPVYSEYNGDMPLPSLFVEFATFSYDDSTATRTFVESRVLVLNTASKQATNHFKIDKPNMPNMGVRQIWAVFQTTYSYGSVMFTSSGAKKIPSSADIAETASEFSTFNTIVSKFTVVDVEQLTRRRLATEHKEEEEEEERLLKSASGAVLKLSLLNADGYPKVFNYDVSADKYTDVTPLKPKGGYLLQNDDAPQNDDDVTDDNVDNDQVDAGAAQLTPKNPPAPPGSLAEEEQSYCFPWQTASFWKGWDDQNKELGAFFVEGETYPKPLEGKHAGRNLLKSNFEGASKFMLGGFQSLMSGTVISFIGLPLSLVGSVCLPPHWFWLYEFLLYLAFIGFAAGALHGMVMTDFQKKELWTLVFPTCDSLEVSLGPVYPVLVFQIVWFSSYLLYLVGSQVYSMCGGNAKGFLCTGRSAAYNQDAPKPPPLPFLIALIKSTKPYSKQELEDFVVYLGDNTVDVNVKDQEGFTPLLWGCRLSKGGCKDFFVEQILMHPYCDIEYSCEGRNALQWCVAQSTKDLIIAFTQAHLAVMAGHAGADEYQAAGFTFKEEACLEDDQEAPPPPPEEESPVEQQAIEGLPEPPPPDALEVIQQERKKNLFKTMQAASRLAGFSKARPSENLVVPTTAEVMEEGKAAAVSKTVDHDKAKRLRAEQDLNNLKAAQDDALSTLEAKQKAAKDLGSASLLDRLGKRRAEKEAQLRAQGASEEAVAAALAADEAAATQEVALENELAEARSKAEVRAQFSRNLQAAAEKKKASQIEYLKQGASDALSMLESKQATERKQAESSLAQRIAARKAARQTELQAKGVSDTLIAEALALEETQAKQELQEQLQAADDEAYALLVAKVETSVGVRTVPNARPVAQTAAQQAQEKQNIQAAAAMHAAQIDAELAAKQAAAKSKLQARLHRDPGVVAIPSSAAAAILNQNAATAAVLESEMIAKQAAAKKRLQERMMKK